MDTGKTVIARIPNPNAGPTILKTASEVVTMDLKDAPPGSQPAIVEGDNYPLEVRQKIAERFSIGPVVDTAFWSNERGSMNIDRGPWTSAIDYIRALADREISWIKEHTMPRSPDDPLFTFYSQNDPAEHISLLQKYLTVTPHLIPQDKDILGSFLWHTDLRTPNIFVDNSGHITSIIDWQSTWAGPLFLEGRHPQFLDYAGDSLLKPPKNFKQLDNDTQKDLREKISRSILLYLYENKYSEEKLTPGQSTPIPQRQDINSSNPLYPTTKCPITFTPNEIHKHHKDSEGWNEVQDFWVALSGILSRDG
ncbi:phosphotransferase enzyme [Aspergillus niger]|nr:phosphotransferase enzyme [Aspergillus niger]